MTKKNLKPQQAAPVQRELTATVSHDGNAIAPLWGDSWNITPFAGDDAE